MLASHLADLLPGIYPLSSRLYDVSGSQPGEVVEPEAGGLLPGVAELIGLDDLSWPSDGPEIAPWILDCDPPDWSFPEGSDKVQGGLCSAVCPFFE